MTTKDQINERKLPDVRPGDIVRVHVKIKEGEKERQQYFEGVIIKRQGGKGPAASITVRKISEGIGVERKFMLRSPFMVKIEIKKRSSVKKADLSYLRNIRQVHRHLKDRKIEPFEEMLVEEAIVEEKELKEEQKEAIAEAVEKEKEKEEAQKTEEKKEETQEVPEKTAEKKEETKK